MNVAGTETGTDGTLTEVSDGTVRTSFDLTGTYSNKKNKRQQNQQ
jgi:hypothetical protein